MVFKYLIPDYLGFFFQHPCVDGHVASEFFINGRIYSLVDPLMLIVACNFLWEGGMSHYLSKSFAQSPLVAPSRSMNKMMDSVPHVVMGVPVHLCLKGFGKDVGKS